MSYISPHHDRTPEENNDRRNGSNQTPPVRATVERHRSRWRLRGAGWRGSELGNDPLRRPARPAVAVTATIKRRSPASGCPDSAVADVAADRKGYRSGRSVGHAIAIQRADHPLYRRQQPNGL